METSVPQHKAYWRKSLTITWLALALWLLVTVLMAFYAQDLRHLTVVYAIMTVLYAWYLSRQERIYRC